MRFLFFPPEPNKSGPIHKRILVFVPAYEGSLLYDSHSPVPGKAPCVWGSVEGLRKQELYGAIRLPTPLVAKPMLRAGPIEVYQPFISFLTRPATHGEHFPPFVEGRDLFIFAYDWRQDIATVTAPLLNQKLGEYLKLYAQASSEHDPQPEIVFVAHSMGGLIVRTLLEQNPHWYKRVSRLFMLGTPHRGSIKALKTLAVGPGGLRENELSFPVSLLRWLPCDISQTFTKLVAISRPSLYQLLPQDDPQWEVKIHKRNYRIRADDLLRVSMWRHFWPTAEMEKKLYLEPWLDKEAESGRPVLDRREYEFCQDPELPKLKKILDGVTQWKKKIGTVRTTHEKLTHSGEPSRLWSVLGTGFKTPKGFCGKMDGRSLRGDVDFHDFQDGDETVPRCSTLDDLPDNANILELPNVSHGRLVNHPVFWTKLAHFLRE